MKPANLDLKFKKIREQEIALNKVAATITQEERTKKRRKELYMAIIHFIYEGKMQLEYNNVEEKKTLKILKAIIQEEVENALEFMQTPEMIEKTKQDMKNLYL